MIRNFKDIVILLITSGVLLLLGVIIIGDYWVALEENRPVDESVITLMKMSVTGLIGVIGGYIGGSKYDIMFFEILTQFGLPVAAAVTMGGFIYIILKYILGGVVGSVKGLHGIIMSLENRIDTMNNDLIHIDTLISSALHLKPDLDRIARSDGKNDERKD